MTLSRRAFLKLSGAGLATSVFPLPPEEALRPINALGRAARTIPVRERPSAQAKETGLLRADTVFNIYETVESAEESYNRQWHAVQGGFVYSGNVQPVKWKLQQPSLDLPPTGFLGEITVPYTSARAWHTPPSTEVHRLYYGTTYWVTQAKTNAAGEIWYRITDDRNQQLYWALGRHVRRVAPEEINPIAPDITDKRIEVDLAQQTFRCYENGTLVLDTLCSTGTYLRTEGGRRIYGTPAGEWAIMRKRPTRHMAGDDAASADFFDLPGVPWVSYFHWWGTAVHGTYWHNDFGAPHSHGCLNLPSELAKWVFRWTAPHPSALEEQTLAEGNGTSLTVY